MKQEGKALITRRQALISLSTIAAAAMARPASVFCSPVKDKLRFAVIGDWGTGDRHALGTATQMFSAHQRSALDFVISAGDNIYPNGAGRYLARNFEQPFSSLIKDRISFYTVLGNHDVDEGRQDQNSYPLFNMGGQNYYKIEKGEGLADFFMLDSTDFTQNQAAWLDSSLSASRARWKIAVFHHPIYSSSKQHGSALGLRKMLEPMFVRYKVNAVFSGHDHIYERTKPQQGVQYFVTGAGGKVRNGSIDRSSPFTQTTFDDDNHFMVLDVDDKQIGFEAISETGTIVDSGTIAQA